MVIKIGGYTPATTQSPEVNVNNVTTQEADLSGLGGTPDTAPAETQVETPDTSPSTDEDQQTQATNPGPVTQTAQVPGHQSQASHLIQGGAQQSAVDQVKATQDMRAKLRSTVREFWLDPGQFAKLVFLDGKLLTENVFDTPMVATHMLQIGGKWAKFVCNKHTEGQCIVCDSNADKSAPDTVQLFTVINVMPYIIQGGPNKGKTLPARLQLFAANMKTREKLISRAKNNGGGLAGGLYQFSRSDKQAARTGDDIEFLQGVDLGAVLKKFPMLNTVKNAKGEWKDAPTTLIDYAKAFPVLTNADIASMRPDLASMAGFSAFTPQSGAAMQGGFGNDPTGDIDDELPF